MKPAVNVAALDSAIWGANWDLSVCEQRLQARASCCHDDPMANHHLLCAIDALQGARASLASAERFAAKVQKGGAL